MIAVVEEYDWTDERALPVSRVRICLLCGREFLSPSAAHRRCPECVRRVRNSCRRSLQPEQDERIAVHLLTVVIKAGRKG